MQTFLDTHTHIFHAGSTLGMKQFWTGSATAAGMDSGVWDVKTCLSHLWAESSNEKHQLHPSNPFFTQRSQGGLPGVTFLQRISTFWTQNQSSDFVQEAKPFHYLHCHPKKAHSGDPIKPVLGFNFVLGLRRMLSLGVPEEGTWGHPSVDYCTTSPASSTTELIVLNYFLIKSSFKKLRLSYTLEDPMPHVTIFKKPCVQNP